MNTLPVAIVDIAAPPGEDPEAIRLRLASWADQRGIGLSAGQWGIVETARPSVIADPTARGPVIYTHWFIDFERVPASRAIRGWRYWGARASPPEATTCLVLVRGLTADDEAGEPAEVSAPARLAPATAAPQLELAHAAPGVFPHARLCAKCEGPVELYPGRGGRPRTTCESCQPPFWPRKGERWWLDGEPTLVLGSFMTNVEPCAPLYRVIRYRKEGDSKVRTVDGCEWRQRAQREAPTQDEESAA